MNQTIQPSLSNKMPYSLGDKLCLPRKEQTVDLSQKADSFEAQSLKTKSPVKKEAQKQSASYAWLIGGSVVVLGLVGLAIYQREALASSWEKLFKKSATEPPKPPVVPQKPPVSLMTEALQAQLDALPQELKPHVTAYDLTDKNQFNELRIYVQGLHELRNTKNSNEQIKQSIRKIENSVGRLEFNEAWIALAQAKRLSGNIENGKPTKVQMNESYPNILFKYGLGTDEEYTNSGGGSFLTPEMHDLFQNVFHLSSTELGTYDYIRNPNKTNPDDPYDTFIDISKSYTEVLDQLKNEPNGSFFLVSHYLEADRDSHNLRQHLALNLNGELYIVPDSFLYNQVDTLEGFMEKILHCFNDREGTNMTKDSVVKGGAMRYSGLRLDIRKFEDLQIHPWLLKNETP